MESGVWRHYRLSRQHPHRFRRSGEMRPHRRNFPHQAIQSIQNPLRPLFGEPNRGHVQYAVGAPGKP